MKARLHIQVAADKGCSYLKPPFFTTPFKLANITENKKSHWLHLTLMSSSPGILDNDVYDIKIEVEENAALHLHTQAYQRLFNMKNGASQQVNVYMEEGASFCFLPHPSVPHEESSFTNRSNFYLGNRCRLVFGEILTCGRKLNGELFLFKKYHSITHVFINNRLVIKENLLMQPGLIDVTATGQLEGYTHQASMIWLQENADIKAFQGRLIEMLAAEKNIEYGVTVAPVNGLIIRILGNGAEQLHSCLQRINEILSLTKTIQDAG